MKQYFRIAGESIAHEILGSSSTQDLAIANHVAEDGMARFAGNQLWPCGVRGGMSYDLMTGLAGIGHFYLRLYDRTVPSAVLLRPESFSGTTGTPMRRTRSTNRGSERSGSMKGEPTA